MGCIRGLYEVSHLPFLRGSYKLPGVLEVFIWADFKKYFPSAKRGTRYYLGRNSLCL